MAEAPAVDVSPERVGASSRALLVVDDDCVCVEASLGACLMLGVGRAEIVGRAVETLLEAESRQRFAHVWYAFRTSGGHAGPFALEAPASVVAVSATVSAEVLPSRHLIILDQTPTPPEPGADSPGGFPSLVEPPQPRSPTAREREVLQLLAEGRTDSQIAELLELSPATVQTHVRNAKAKLGARTRAQAVAVSLRRGLIGT